MSKFIAVLAAITFAIARAPYRYDFPRDHFAHDAYRTEWWYYTGHLEARSGRRFGYELTFFRFALVPHRRELHAGESEWRAAQLYPAHFAITDIARNRFNFVETIGREALNQAGASESALNVWVNDWRVSQIRSSRAFAMHLRASSAAQALDLTLTPLKAPAIHGAGGISRKGPCSSCASHYYSFTRIATRGTLTVGGRRFGVLGISWMDHEFGSSELTPQQTGWDWFSMQLTDGREIMLYRLRERGGNVTPQSSGSLIGPDGHVNGFSFSQVTLNEQAQWTSPHTGALYPSEWLVSIPGVAHAIHVVPAAADQELVDPSGTLTYWEGAVDLFDATSGAHVGVGYVELTGYAAASAIRL